MLDFGVEIECLLPERHIEGRIGLPLQAMGGFLAQELCDAGVHTLFEGYNHHTRGHWKVVTDATVRHPNYLGLEVVSPPLNEPGLSQIDMVCNKLEALGARTNKTCGLHVHVNARYLRMEVLRRIAYLYIENEDVIDGLMPPSRRGNGNEWCRSLKNRAGVRAIEQAQTAAQLAQLLQGGDKYSKLNFKPHDRIGTVEFRQHSGTIDPVKIVKWVRFCTRLVEQAQRTASEPIVLDPRDNAAVTRRIQRARQLRIIYELVSRTEGCTSVEAQTALGRQTPPALASDLTRIGVPFRTEGRRGGHKVYRLEPSPIEPATLISLLRKLELPEEDAAFWQARAALFGNIIDAVASEEG